MHYSEIESDDLIWLCGFVAENLDTEFAESMRILLQNEEEIERLKIDWSKMEIEEWKFFMKMKNGLKQKVEEGGGRMVKLCMKLV